VNAADQGAHASNVRRLAGSSAKRRRVGDIRVILAETDILVTKIGPRGGAHD
jgi:hypothetical protein